jgi:HD-GYP domain-containing protein (c-di-GMP phosphodiesterase class II)
MGDSFRAQRRAALDLAVPSGDELREHARRVARLGLVIADGLGVDDATREDVELCALLHDVGKSALPMRVLAKPAPLDEEEWALMRIHTVEGERMVVEAGLGARLGALVRATHERWDGGGYPDGTAGADIPLTSRIVFCADAFDAMTNTRPYRRALPQVAAVAEVRRGAGTQFDPRVAGRFAAIVERLEGRFRRTPRDRDPRAAFPR